MTQRVTYLLHKLIDHCHTTPIIFFLNLLVFIDEFPGKTSVLYRSAVFAHKISNPPPLNLAPVLVANFSKPEYVICRVFTLQKPRFPYHRHQLRAAADQRIHDAMVSHAVLQLSSAAHRSPGLGSDIPRG